MTLKVKKIIEGAVLPTYNHEGDAGLDIYALHDVMLLPGQSECIATGVAVAIPEGSVGLIWDRSGLSMAHSIKTLGGVIDASYRGEIVIGLINLSRGVYNVHKGDKIAQMLVQRVERVTVEEVGELEDTMRGDRGFGSSGK